MLWMGTRLTRGTRYMATLSGVSAATGSGSGFRGGVYHRRVMQEDQVHGNALESLSCSRAWQRGVQRKAISWVLLHVQYRATITIKK